MLLELAFLPPKWKKLNSPLKKSQKSKIPSRTESPEELFSIVFLCWISRIQEHNDDMDSPKNLILFYISQDHSNKANIISEHYKGIENHSQTHAINRFYRTIRRITIFLNVHPTFRHEFQNHGQQKNCSEIYCRGKVCSRSKRFSQQSLELSSTRPVTFSIVRCPQTMLRWDIPRDWGCQACMDSFQENRRKHKHYKSDDGSWVFKLRAVLWMVHSLRFSRQVLDA